MDTARFKSRFILSVCSKSPTPGGIIALNYRRVSGSSGGRSFGGLRFGGLGICLFPSWPLRLLSPAGAGAARLVASRDTTYSTLTTSNFLQFPLPPLPNFLDFFFEDEFLLLFLSASLSHLVLLVVPFLSGGWLSRPKQLCCSFPDWPV